MRAEETVVQILNGRKVTTIINVTPIYSEGGWVVSVVATLRDVRPLEELERPRAEFLGIVSHELWTPLTSVAGPSAITPGSAHRLDPAETPHFFRIIDEQADHKRDLINDPLDVTRMEAESLVAGELNRCRLPLTSGHPLAALGLLP